MRTLPLAGLLNDNFRSKFARIVATQMVYGMGFSVFAIVPTMLSRRAGTDERDVGFATATLALGALATAPFAGLALDRYGRVLVVRVGIVVTTVALLAMSLSLDSNVGRLLSCLLGGAAFVLVFNGTTTLAADTAPADRVARAVGWLGAAGMIAHALAPTIAEALAPVVGWRAVFAGAALVSATASFASLGLEDPPGLGRVTGVRGLHAALVKLGPMPLVALFAGGTYAGIYAFHQPLLVEQGATAVRAYFLGFTAGALVMRLGFGSLPDRLGHARATRLALAGYAVVSFAFVWVTPTTLGLFGAAHGVVHGVFYPASAALALLRVEPRDRGLASALVNGAFNAGHAAASLVYGLVASRYSTRWVFVLGAVFSLAGLLAVRARQRGTSTV